MKKCPVCGVEHSDIVHVCSICGSPLDDAANVQNQNAPAGDTPETAPETPVQPPVSEEKPVMSEDTATDDIRKTISSVVNGTVEEQAGETAPETSGESFEVDNPFVIDTTKEPAEQPRPSARRPRRSQRGSKPRNPDMDTTIVAAASAQKVYEATQNAINARNAQANAAQSAPEPAAPAAEPQTESTAGEIQWTQRKHTRSKTKSSQRVVLAVCAFLALLIVAILVVFGKMIFGGDTGASKDNPAAPTDSLLTEEGDVQPTAAPTETTEIVTEAPTEPVTELTEAATTQEDVVDPDLAVQQQENNGTETGTPAETDAEPTQAPTHPAELPAITEADDTVYAVSDVNVRDYPGTQGSSVIKVLTAGQSVKRTGTTANGWSRVESDGKVGYVSSKYLSTNKDDVNKAQSGDGSVTITSNGVNLRDKPNGAVIATLNSGDKVKPTGKTQGTWTEVSYNGKTGYIYSSYVSGGSTASDVKVKETNDTMYAVSGVNVRSDPSTSGSVLTTLTGGQEVKRIGTTGNGWSKIKVGNVTGYVYSSYLSSSKGGSSDSGNSGSKKNGYVLPDSASKVYSLSELKKLSKSQLRLARNEIYARHGRKFNDKSLQDYFNGCSWYKGTVDPDVFDANVNSYLNDYEIANLSGIKEAEGN